MQYEFRLPIHALTENASKINEVNFWKHHADVGKEHLPTSSFYEMLKSICTLKRVL